jgi:hypothetical protein
MLGLLDGATQLKAQRRHATGCNCAATLAAPSHLKRSGPSMSSW